jgi:phosphoribosylamine--glycine ligase
MGAYAPVSLATPDLIDQVARTVFTPTLDALRDGDAAFTGLLYAGLMLTGEGPKVVEFNCRFGDPETEAILPLLRTGLLEPMAAVARGDHLTSFACDWLPACAVTTVVAAAGYPDAPRTGDPVALPAPRPDVHLFHAGTARDAAGKLVTAGGRVIAVTAVDSEFEHAAQRSATAAAAVAFSGRQYRRDIGWRELSRRARAT